VFPPDQAWADRRRLEAFLDGVAAAGLDHVCTGDHVSFFVGAGFDGLLHAAMVATLHPELPVHTGVYLLPLRHPVLVARQLADFEKIAPGRLVFGVGIGGEDRHEVTVCGVDPATRGQRMDECLAIVRGLLSGRPMTFHGEFFDLDEALIAPTPPAPVPIVVGGRSDAAVRRAGRLADGWLGIWASPRRFADAVGLAAAEASRAGRAGALRHHAMQVWCGLDRTRETARQALAPAMEALYQIPFERFERYSPYGTPDDVAAFLSEHVDAGCSTFNLIPQSQDDDGLIEAAAAVKHLLAGLPLPQARTEALTA
jgi:alkanesulfonate monooxygenase SsuD/methylene tetrahydromethanopterin reductase-like flavin-dependent oxidoreductase (luciferase family)